VAQKWISAKAGLADGGKNKKIHQEEELFSEVVQENDRRRLIGQQMTGPYCFADFSPFQFAGDRL